MGRAPCCEKVGLKKGRWTTEEDELLLKYIQANGEGSWRSLPKNAGLLRCGKSCRLRWINYLRADLKRGNISKEEEDVIIKLHASYGNRWSLIAGSLPGRTDNEIKNYWNSHLSRRIDSVRRINDGAPIVIVDMDKIPGGCKRKGTITSKSAVKKKKKNHQEELGKEKQKSIAKIPSTISNKNEDEAKIPATFQQESEVILDTISIAEIPSIISNRNEDQEKTPVEVLCWLSCGFPHVNLKSNSPATFQQESEVILDTSAVKENEERLESGISSPSKGSENEREENGCLCIEERRTESGVSGSKEESESGGNGGNEERCENEEKEIEWYSLMDTCFEEIGSLQEDFSGFGFGFGFG